ncbi:MAG: intermembrane transport protein PqiB, partial [Acetobacteraceae bacterium]
QSLTATLATTDALMKQLDTGAAPALRRLPEIAASLQAMLTNTNKLVASTDAGYGDNSKFHRDLNRAMGQLTDMMQSLRELADLLTRHPEALVRGRTDTGRQ